MPVNYRIIDDGYSANIGKPQVPDIWIEEKMSSKLVMSKRPYLLAST